MRELSHDRQMKKLTALILCLVMVAALFTACSEDPKTALANATAKTSELASYESNAKINMKVSVSGVSMDIPIDANVKYSKKDDAIQMSTDMALELMGMQMEMNMYYADGVMYTDAMGQKLKTAMDLEELSKTSASVVPMESDMITELKTEKVDAGTKYTPTIDDTKMSEFANTVMKKAQTGAGEAADLDALENTDFSNVQTYVIVNADGYAVEQWVSMDIVAKAEMPDATGETAETEIKMTIEMTNNIVNPGQEVTVTAPENLEDYQSADAAI